MREKVMSLAQGRFTYEQPEIVCSIDCLKLEVVEGGEAASSFTVSNSAGTKIKGFGAVDHFNIEFLPVFDGKENEITVKVYAANKKAGEIMTGDLCIVTDCGEYMLPYEIRVLPRCLRSSDGEIHSYEEFVELARENFEEAVTIFYHDKFKKIYLQEWGEKRLYQNLTLKNPKKQALEEFLVVHGDKKPVRFAANKRQIFFEVRDEDIDGEILIALDNWGMAGIQVSTKSSYISLEKNNLSNKDFLQNQAVLAFHIQASKVPEGIHRCVILLENVYQKLEIGVRLHGIRGRKERAKKRSLDKLPGLLTRYHIQYMMNSSLKDEWLRVLVENREGIGSLSKGNDVLLEGYMAVLTGEERKMTAFVNAVTGMPAPALGDSVSKVFCYLTTMYIRCLALGSLEEKSELCRRIREYYDNGCHHWRLLVMLERLGYFQGSSQSLMEELDLLWKEGAVSPYLHLYRMLLLLQEPELLKLDSSRIGALRFGLRHDLITEDLAMAVSFLAVRQKNCTPALLSVLQGCYELYGSEDTLQSICALMIRTEKLEARYFKWFRLGVERRLRLTELFEYYMYTMDKACYDEALPVVATYFQYENHLRDSVRAGLYASIVRNQERYPEYYQSYHEAMQEYTLRQLYDHHISPELAVLYEEFFSVDKCKDRIARELPGVLFVHRLHCHNKNMERVVVLHDEGGGEMFYNLVNGEADVSIGTSNYKLYFVDKNGYYHGDSVPYTLTKILNLECMAQGCYENGSENPVLLLYLFSEILKKKDIGAKDAILLHTMIRRQVPGVEYRQKTLLILYDYYKAIGEELLLEEVIRGIDFRYLTQERRAGILQTMIQHEWKDEALSALKKYEITSCSLKLLLLLITWKLEEDREHFEPYYMKLCSFLYQRGIKNKEILSYLVDFYMGSISVLYDIYQTARKNGAEISDGGTERLLGQALFVEDNLEKYADIFVDYYEYGANRILVKAFLGGISYGYLTERWQMPEGIWEKIRREGLSEENQSMILASLRYYAQKDEYTEAEREYIEYHLSHYASTGRIFSFMKGFVGKVEVPFAVLHGNIIQLYYSHSKDIYIELSHEDGEKEICQMKPVFQDIYVYETLLFRGETVHYQIFAGREPRPVRQGVIRADEETFGETGEPGREAAAFYELVNCMIQARENGEDEVLRQLIRKYRSMQEISGKLFVPL